MSPRLAPLLLAALLAWAPRPAPAQVVWRAAGEDPPPEVAVTGGAARMLSLALERWTPASPPGLGGISERVVVGLLPAPLRAACDSLVGRWGSGPENRPEVSVRPLWVSPPEAEARAAVLAFRCGSTHPSYRDRAVDDRLAVPRLAPGGGTLSVLEDARDCAACPLLGRFGPPADVSAHPVAGGVAVAIPYALSSDNPCCGGTESARQEREVWVALAGEEARLAASVLLDEEREGHVHGEGA